MESLKFIHTQEIIPEFKSYYQGLLVLDGNNDFYIGLNDKWKKLADTSEIPEIEDSLTSESVEKALSANQGKLLNDRLSSVEEWKSTADDDIDNKVDKVEGSSLVSDDKVSSYDEHLSNTSNPHSVTKEQVGLGSVDNTADIDKPISTATQAALDEINQTIEDNEEVTSAALNDINDLKADKSTTLSGYGITDAYTKDEVDTTISGIFNIVSRSEYASLTPNTNTLYLIQEDGAIVAMYIGSIPCNFVAYNNDVLNLILTASSGGSVTGAGNYTAGTSVVITATPDTDYEFTEWSDGNTDNPRTVTVDSNITLKAIFTKTSYYVSAAGDSYGEVDIPTIYASDYDGSGIDPTAKEGYYYCKFQMPSEFAGQTISVRTRNASHSAVGSSNVTLDDNAIGVMNVNSSTFIYIRFTPGEGKTVTILGMVNSLT